jgi:hypothetical protein
VIFLQSLDVGSCAAGPVDRRTLPVPDRREPAGEDRETLA